MMSSVTEVLNNSHGLIQEHVLGEVRPEQVPWLSITYKTEREGISNAINLTLEVLVLRENLPEGWTWKRDLVWAQRHQISGHKFGSLAADSTQAERFALSVFSDLARRFAPTFYEVDPRIGQTMAGKKFPMSPLFDPSVSIQRPDFCFDFYQRVTEWLGGRGEDRHFYPQKYPGPGCVFCRENVVEHEHPEEVLWGGGNVGWVHHSCAPWIVSPPDRVVVVVKAP
jgi:hypothetical protein